MNPFAILPWYYRWIALAVALLAAMLFGAAKVYKWEESKHAKETAAIKLEGEKQNARTAQIVAQQKQITANVVSSYDADINRINRYYDDQLRVANSRRREVPAVPKAAAPTCPKPANNVFVAGDSAGIEFKRQCTITTEMFVKLRDWLLQQGQTNVGNN